MRALVYKADKRSVKKVTFGNRVGGHPRFVLLGHGKVEHSETAVLSPVAIGYGFAEHFKGIARKQCRLVRFDIRLEAVRKPFKILEHELLVFLGSRADEHKAVIVKINVVAEGFFNNLAVRTALRDHSFKHAHVAVVAVKIHNIIIKMQNFHIIHPLPSPKIYPCPRSR